jgi:hypothetical protein
MRGIEDDPQTVIQTAIQCVVATGKDIEFGVIEDLNCGLSDALKIVLRREGTYPVQHWRSYDSITSMTIADATENFFDCHTSLGIILLYFGGLTPR